jgi:hypothetical protein
LDKQQNDPAGFSGAGLQSCALAGACVAQLTLPVPVQVPPAAAHATPTGAQVHVGQPLESLV